MTRSTRHDLFFCAALSLLASFALSCREAERQAERTNLVWIVLDTCRAESFSAYGYERETTPNLQALASRGVLFEQNFAQWTWTARSVPSYMTGRYFPAQSVGIYGETFGLRDVRLPAEGELMLTEVLALNGYETLMVSKSSSWFQENSRLTRSFDRFISVPGTRPPKPRFDELNEIAIPYLENQPREKPFFLYLHAWDCHFPHVLDPPYDLWIEPDLDFGHIDQSGTLGARRRDGGELTEADRDHLRALYDGSLRRADAGIGRLLDTLNSAGLDSSTYVVVSSDHGEALGEDGHTTGHGGTKTSDEVTHVPLIIAGPGLPAGRRVSQITENVDIFPTLVDLLDLSSRAIVDGRSLLPVIEGLTESTHHDSALTIADGKPDLGMGDLLITSISIRTPRFRYEYGAGGERLFEVPDRLQGRSNRIADFPQEAALFRGLVESRILPLAKAAARTPLLATFLNMGEIFAPVDAHNEALTSGTSSSTDGTELRDNRWQISGGVLSAASFSEQPPPVHINQKVRPDSYRLIAEVLCHADLNGHPAASISLQLPELAETRLVVCTTDEQSLGRYLFKDVARISLPEGELDVTLRPGVPTHWAILRSLVLVPDDERALNEFSRLFGTTSSTKEELEATQDHLKALGYL